MRKAAPAWRSDPHGKEPDQHGEHLDRVFKPLSFCGAAWLMKAKYDKNEKDSNEDDLTVLRQL